MHPLRQTSARMGGDYRIDTSSDAEQLQRARHASPSPGSTPPAARRSPARSGADFADFLLGVPQQATLQVGGTTHLRQRSFDAYIEDNWQKNAKLTFNLGLRYELALPYVEVNGQMSNLDVTPDFTAAAPVISGGSGPVHRRFPARPAEHRRQQPRPAPRRRVPRGARAPSCAAATASPTTAGRTRPSRGNSSRSRRSPRPRRSSAPPPDR